MTERNITREKFRYGYFFFYSPTGTYALETELLVIQHYEGLPDRIDYSPDFVLTKEIVDRHWQGGSGEDLYVNQANIQLPGVTTKDFNSMGYE
ncbi:hypothetical protein LVD15_19370 [Fulvivirga maritima]|uniref:hypothetical protein n=1 Tax=Fulvivirga maritima TaxID=2904247 RepID=UPI001F3AA313|nr:hypothetical protein [Fulvivirga maritima]UII25445.1 hypothetical protein LVD15_19370 [Fulvivirga maritima]